MPPRGLLAVLLIMLAACGREDAASGGRGPNGGGADRPAVVGTQVVRMAPFADTLQALGTVKARESVTVTASVSEKVSAVHFDSGQRVRAGAPLVTLSGQAEAAALTEAAAAANEADRQYRRLSELAGSQLIARSQLDAQRAPFAGVLGLRQVSPGALVSPGTVITTLDDISRVHVDFPMPETQLAQVGAGQAIQATAATYPGRTFEGAVSTIDARIDPATRAVTVRGEFANADGALKPGMLLQVQVQRAERQALLVPEIAVVQAGNESYVFRVNNEGVAERADVQLGTRANGRVEIVEGLRAGDRVVVDGTNKLRPGQKISEGGAARAATRGG